jgi:hypothetical protein
LFDLFVDIAEHFLVPSCSLCEVHERLYHLQAVSNRPVRGRLSRRYACKGKAEGCASRRVRLQQVRSAVD